MYLTRKKKVKPFTKPTESESSWTQPSKTDHSSLSAVAAGLEDAISVDAELGSSTTIARSEIRRSKSKVRSYLKKCKNAIIGTTSGHTDNEDPITHHEPISQQSATSSWYLDEISAEEKIGELINQPNDEELTTTSDEDAGNVAIAYDCSTTREEILDTSSDSHGFEANCGVANLVDRYLGHLYPEYLEHTRPVLIRQARDLLVCTFHGDLTKFEEDFLAPAATIIDAAKKSCCTSETGKDDCDDDDEVRDATQSIVTSHEEKSTLGDDVAPTTTDMLKQLETSETEPLTNQQLQRVVLLRQIKILELQQQKLELDIANAADTPVVFDISSLNVSNILNADE